MTLSTRGPWSPAEIEDYLGKSRYPLRLACTGADGFPRVVSLWYRYEGGVLYCATHQASALARLLRGNDKVGFEIAPNEPPYFGVRGQGIATLQAPGAEQTLRELLETYLGGVDSDLAQWLLSRGDEELLISITPRRLYSWDYRERMDGA